MHVIRCRRGTCRVGAGVMLCAVLIGAPSQGSAQQPVPGPAPSPAVPSPVVAYRPPVIALVQPPNGGPVPQDKPVVVFRFAPGEAGDPLDVRTFTVTVDGDDRTPLFQVTAGEAWGPIVAEPGDDPLSPGPHAVVARICSSRGACADVSATVTVVPATVAPSTPENGAPRKKKLIDLLIDLGRKLLRP